VTCEGIGVWSNERSESAPASTFCTRCTQSPLFLFVAAFIQHGNGTAEDSDSGDDAQRFVVGAKCLMAPRGRTAAG
jgi:hypothetical protein